MVKIQSNVIITNKKKAKGEKQREGTIMKEVGHFFF